MSRAAYTGPVLVSWSCPYCRHVIRPELGERAIGAIVGRELQYRHIVCPGEELAGGPELES